MCIGTIVTKSKNVDTNSFVCVTDNFDISSGITMPTLIVGKKLAQHICGCENIHLLDRKISDNLYWTFAKTEQRSEYEKDLKEFNSKILESLLRKITYKNLNIFTEPMSVIKRFVAFMNGKSQKIIYASYNMLYVYCHGTVYGASISDLQYVGITRSKVFKKLRENRNNTIITDDKFIDSSVKRFAQNHKMFVPYLYFLKNS